MNGRKLQGSNKVLAWGYGLLHRSNARSPAAALLPLASRGSGANTNILADLATLPQPACPSSGPCAPTGSNLDAISENVCLMEERVRFTLNTAQHTARCRLRLILAKRYNRETNQDRGDRDPTRLYKHRYTPVRFQCSHNHRTTLTWTGLQRARSNKALKTPFWSHFRASECKDGGKKVRLPCL